jgi:hypothetical protein
MNTISEFAKCCAHCGWIEPSNIDEILNDFTSSVGGVYVHNEECIAMENDGVEHDLFMALWNARTHIKINDFLLPRAKDSLERAMTAYIKNQLNSESWFCIREQDKFWTGE